MGHETKAHERLRFIYAVVGLFDQQRRKRSAQLLVSQFYYLAFGEDCQRQYNIAARLEALQSVSY
jgi:hypothetical protein